jgi:hypothetical protein
LKLSATPKLAQPWQAYLNKFQDSKLKPNIEEAWQQYLSGVPEGEKPKITQFEIQNNIARKLYEKETPEVKQEVQEHRLKMRDAGTMDTSTIDRNKSFQR